MRKINSLHVIIVKNGETKSSHRAWNEFILLANLSLWQWSSHWTKSIGGNGKASISLTHCALCEKQQLSCFDCQHFPYIFFQISQIGLILNKMQNSQSKSSAFLLELYRLKCNSICIHHHSKKQQTRQKTRLYSPSWVDWWTTKCCKWSASTELNLICWKIDKNGHVAGTAKDSCQAYHFCNKQPKPAISWCMEI